MKKIQIIFISLCMLVCLIPFAGMAFFPTEKTAENRRPAEFPSLTTQDGALNTEFFSGFDRWFNEHFAFRNELVAADSKLLGTVFGSSAEDQVIYGTDGWLYYASTLEDYTGSGCMTERERFNLKHNLEITLDWAKDRGVALVLTVPPNKNTLYGDHMPYYDSMIADPAHTLDYLSEICGEINLPYADLYALFKNESETLYLKRDSHWNGKGALLAYNCIMERTKETLGIDYEDYSDAAATRAKDADGDLNRMLYTFYGEKEMDIHYDIEQRYSYITDTESVEDAWIQTKTSGKTGSLLMFRDSFGNTLLPYIADQFESACFTKESPYRLQKLVTEQKPDLVIIEKVERNLRDFITEPPIISAPEASSAWQSDQGIRLEKEQLDLRIEDCPYDPSMIRVSGDVPEEFLHTESEILVQVNGTLHRTYHINANGFMVYLERDEMKEDSADIRVLVR